MAPAGFDCIWKVVDVEFFSEIADVDVYDITIPSFVVFVGMSGDVVTRNDFIFLEGEAFEQVVFPPSEWDFITTPVDGFGGGVERDVSDLDQGRFTLVFAPDLGSDTGDEFFKGKGFDEIIVGSTFEPFDPLV